MLTDDLNCSSCPTATSCCFQRKIRHRPIKIFHRIQAVPSLNHSDPDRVHPRIQQILPMLFRVHPRVLNHQRAGSFSHILRDHAEPRAGRLSPRHQLRFAVVLVRDRFASRHLFRVIARRLVERAIPAQRLQSPLCPFRIRCGKEILLGNRWAVHQPWHRCQASTLHEQEEMPRRTQTNSLIRTTNPR